MPYGVLDTQPELRVRAWTGTSDRSRLVDAYDDATTARRMSDHSLLRLEAWRSPRPAYDVQLVGLQLPAVLAKLGSGCVYGSVVRLAASRHDTWQQQASVQCHSVHGNTKRQL